MAETTAHTQAPHDAHPAFLGLDAAGWVSLGMVILIGVMLWQKVPAAIGKALDGKIARIRANLDDAERLRREAELLKLEMETRAADAREQADRIVAHAQAEAAGLLATAQADLDTLVARKTAAAEGRIAAAERAAEAEVRARVVDVAVSAVKSVLSGPTTDQERLTAQAIGDVETRLH